LSGLGALAGFFYFVYRQHLDETKLFKDLFLEFNARYDKLNDGMNRILVGRRDGELSETEPCERTVFIGHANRIRYLLGRMTSLNSNALFTKRACCFLRECASVSAM
jgi:hypothetical protein